MQRAHNVDAINGSFPVSVPPMPADTRGSGRVKGFIELRKDRLEDVDRQIAPLRISHLAAVGNKILNCLMARATSILSQRDGLGVGRSKERPSRSWPWLVANRHSMLSSQVPPRKHERITTESVTLSEAFAYHARPFVGRPHSAMAGVN